jgi:hypothetical protein
MILSSCPVVAAVVFGLLLDSRAKFELTEVIQVMCHYASYLRFKNRHDVNAPPITHSHHHVLTAATGPVSITVLVLVQQSQKQCALLSGVHTISS